MTRLVAPARATYLLTSGVDRNDAAATRRNMYGPNDRSGALPSSAVAAQTPSEPPTDGASGPPARRPKTTIVDIRSRKGGVPIAMVTAYDFTMATLLDRAGVDILLIGDSLGMVVQGHTTTLPVTVDEICYHARAVARAAGSAHVVGDMPFMSFQVSPEKALENAGKMMKEGACESVKVEGGVDVAPHVERMVACGIPVMGHVGLLPQSVHAMGGFKVQGKGARAAERVLEDARAIEAAGAYALVLEAIPPDLAQQITESVSIPTIGIGAGPACDGQVLVSYDLLGMYEGRTPKFAKRFAEVGRLVTLATESFVAEVRARSFPAPEHTFRPNGTFAPQARPDDAPDAPLPVDAPAVSH